MKNLSVLRRIGAVALAASMVFTSPSMAAFATELEMTGTEVQSQEDVVSEEETQGSEEAIAPEEEYETKVSSEYPDYQYYVDDDNKVVIQKYTGTDAEFYIEGARTPEEVCVAMLADPKIKAVLENGNYTYIGSKRFNAYTTRDNIALQPVWSITFGDNDSTN